MLSYKEIETKLLSEKSKTWFLTGAAGFIGSNILEKLLYLNQKVIAIDNLSTGFKKNIQQAVNYSANRSNKKIRDINNNLQFYKLDIKNFNDCKRVFRKVDYVIHQAALGSVPRSIKFPIDTNNNNISGFLNILELARINKVKSFVYASSSSNYGDSVKLPKKEEITGNPLSTYALSKIVNEMYAYVFFKNYNFNSIGLRYFNIFGPRQNPKGPYAAVIPQWISSIKDNQTVYINGDGKTTRDFCFIENCVQANLLASLNFSNNFGAEILNIAGGKSITLNNLYKKISNTFNSHIGKSHKKLVYRDFREGDIRFSLADISKAEKIIGYKPNIDVYKGLEIMIKSA